MAASAGEKSFRQLGDVGCPGEISLMKWSPKMDLVAIITAEGAVWLNRLSWQRVWTLRSTDYKAISVAWRPDGKVLVIGLDKGCVHLLNVENSECLHQYDVGSKPDFLDWVSTSLPHSSTSGGIFTEKSGTFLPRLPQLPNGGTSTLTDSKGRDSPWDPKRLQELSGTLSFLITGDQNGYVTLLVHGLLPIGRVNVGSPENCRILSASLDEKIRFLTVVIQTSTSSDFKDNSCVSLVTFDMKLYSLRSEELNVLSLKYGHIASIMSYLDGTFAAMSEAWEDMLVEMDLHLQKYANSLGPETSVSEEFLTLFTCGTASPELEMFLLNDLTEKGLKKLGRTVESSYANVQTLALNNLQLGSNALLYHLNDLIGMAKWYERFGILGLSDAMVAECLKTLGSLMLKTQELLGVIERSLLSFMSFFKWLYLVILQLLDEEVPSFVKEFNQEDVSLVAEFLHCQLRQQDKGDTKFSLERVGQYLKKDPLVFKVDNSENVWINFLQSHPEIGKMPYIFTVDPEKSLAALHQDLTASINAAFEKLVQAAEQTLSCNLRIQLTSCIAGKPEVSQTSSEGGLHQWIGMASGEPVSDKLHLVRLTADETAREVIVAEGICVGFGGCTTDNDGQCRVSVIDFDFYDKTILTLLLRREEADDSSSDSLAQFNFSTFKESQLTSLSQDVNFDTMVENVVDGSDLTVQRRSLERMKAVKVAVSGSRKVACVLSKSRTRVKIFDMNADDEDPDDTVDELQTSAMSTDNGV